MQRSYHQILKTLEIYTYFCYSTMPVCAPDMHEYSTMGFSCTDNVFDFFFLLSSFLSPQLYPETKGQILLVKGGFNNGYFIKKKKKRITPFVF